MFIQRSLMLVMMINKLLYNRLTLMCLKAKLMKLTMKRKKNSSLKKRSKGKVLEFESLMRKDFSTKRSSLKLKIEKLGPFFKMMSLDLCFCDNGHFMIA